jgi:acetyltransferase-like isoleucine patch superfamily enzyme
MIKILYYFNTICFRIYCRFFSGNINIEKHVKINNWPILIHRSNAKMVLGNNVLLNSSNRNYHINMFAAVKLICDKPNAIISIGDNTRIHGSCIHAFERIEIGKNCLIAANCQIFDTSGHGTSHKERAESQGKSKPIIIGDNVWIGAGCIILPGVTIGDGSIVAAGSVVIKSIPENSIYGGNPAQFIRKIEEE